MSYPAYKSSVSLLIQSSGLSSSNKPAQASIIIPKHSSPLTSNAVLPPVAIKPQILTVPSGNISDNTIKEMQICLPDSWDTQISICNFLDEKTYEIEQVIAIKEQQIALLNERKQIVIQKAVTQGLDPNVPMKDSCVDGIGQIPKHWETYFNRRLFRENSRPVRGDDRRIS